MILLDTHVLLWLSGEPRRLSKTATQAIRRAHKSDGLAISCVSLFEIAYLAARGKIVFKGRIHEFIAEIDRRFVVRPLTAQVATTAAGFSEPYPADPIDRIIGATAVVEGMVLVTADERIQRAKTVETLW